MRLRLEAAAAENQAGIGVSSLDVLAGLRPCLWHTGLTGPVGELGIGLAGALSLLVILPSLETVVERILGTPGRCSSRPGNRREPWLGKQVKCTWEAGRAR